MTSAGPLNNRYNHVPNDKGAKPDLLKSFTQVHAPKLVKDRPCGSWFW